MDGTARSEAITREETRGSWALWIGVLTGPAAWTVQLLVDYALEEPLACTPASGSSGEIWGIGIDTIAIAVNAVLFAATVVAGLVAWHCRRVIARGAGNGSGRAGWMALAGIMNSILFGLLIAVAIAPPLVLEVCRS